MAGDIFNFMAVQSTPSGSRVAPAMLVYESGGGQDPENVAANIGGAFENVPESLAWRHYDRAIRQHDDVSGVQFYVWIRNTIQFLSMGFAAIHTISGMDPFVDFGLHTGLYHVTKRDGTEFVCGLYSVQFAGTGFVKFDPRTNAWTSGAIPATSGQGTTMSVCVPFKGFLYHAGGDDGTLQEFDPATNTMREFGSGLGRYAKVAVAGGRLFVLPDNGTGRLLEFAFGSLFNVATFDTQDFGASYASGCDNLMVVGLTGQNTLAIFWNCQQDGSGFRLHLVTVDSPDSPAGALTVAEELGQIPDFSTDSYDAFGQGDGVAYNGAFPAIAGNVARMFTDGGYNLERGPLFSANPQSLVMIKLTGMPESAFGTLVVPPGPTPIPASNSSYETFNLLPGVFPLGYPCNRKRLDWRGTSQIMKYVDAPPDHSVSLTHAQVSSPWGSSNRLFGNGPSVYGVKVEPYADGTIARGMRLTFKIGASLTLGNGGSKLYFGFARYLGRPDTRATLSTGDNPVTYPGGVATFNAGLNRLDNVPPAGGLTLEHDAVVGAFIQGELVQGQTSGVQALATIIGASGLAIFVSSQPAFVDGEQILGLTSGATANLTAPPEDKPTYQIIWDVDADGIPEREWVSLQGAHFNNEILCQYHTSANYQLQTITPQTLPIVAPVTTQGPVEGADANTSASPITTQGPTAEQTPDSAASPGTTRGPVTESSPNTSQTPETTQGPVAESNPNTSGTPITTRGPVAGFETDVDLEANLFRKTVDENTTVESGGVVGFQREDVPVADRDSLTLGSSPVLPGQPWETDTRLPQGPEFAKRLDGVVELGRATLDAVNDAVGTRKVLLDVTAAGLHADVNNGGILPVGSIPGVTVLAVAVRAVALSGFITIRPQVSVGVGGSFDNQVPSVDLFLGAPGQVEPLALAALRPILVGGDVLELELDRQSDNTVYQIEVILYGSHRVG